MPTDNVGETGIGGSAASIANVIRGSKFVTPNDVRNRYGITASAFLDLMGGYGGNIKYAIYKVSDNSLVVEGFGSVSAAGWCTVDLYAPFGLLSPNTEYYFLVWGDTDAGGVRYAVGSSKGVYQNLTYGNWPATLTPTVEDKKCSIYVTASKDVGDEVTKTWYGRSGATITQNGHNGYHLDPANTSSMYALNAADNATLPVTVYIGVKIYRVAPGHVETEMTSGVSCILSKTITLAGYTSGNGAAHNLSACKINADDALMIQVYGGKTNPPTTLLTTFICETSDLEKCLSFKGAWTPTYYLHTYWDDDVQGYYVDFVWGHTVYKLQINIGEPRLIDDLARLVDTTVNWSESLHTKYVALTFKKKTKTDIENAIDALSDWKDILYWTAVCAKLGVERVNQIKAALDNSVMVNGLPKSGNDGSDYFHVEDGDLLIGYKYSDAYQYQTSKWNKLTAKTNLKDCINAAGEGVQKYYSPSGYSLGTERFYDENAQSMRDLMLFYTWFAYSDALSEAGDVWTFLNNNHWKLSFFSYRPISNDYEWECEGGGFLSVIARYYYHCPDAPNISRLVTDLRNRTSKNRWFAPIWMNYATKCSCAMGMIHAWTSNSQRRLQNTIMAVAAMYGVWDATDSSTKIDVKAMLEGYNVTGQWRPAWLLLESEKAGLFSPADDQFRGSTAVALSNLSTVYAACLMLMLGVEPDTGELAVTLEEYHYEYLYNLFDCDLFNLDIANRKLTLAILREGTIKFLFGTTCNYNFTQDGVYEVTFTSDWGSISGVTRTGNLPTNRQYLFKQTIQTITDSMALSDAVYKNVLAYIADSLSAADVVLRDKILELSDAFSLSDATLRNKILEMLDAATLTDLIILTILKEASDSLGVSDSIFRDKSLSMAEQIVLLDTLLTNKQFKISDTAILNDFILALKSLSIADAITLLEIAEVTKGVFNYVTDTLNLSDAVKINKTFILSDTLMLLDQILRHKPEMFIADIGVLAEVVTVSKLLAVADTVNLSDVAHVLKQLGVSDAISLMDAASTPTRILQALDAIGLSDTAHVNKTLIITDQIALVEVIDVGKGAEATKLFLVFGSIVIDLKTGKVGIRIG